MKIAFLTLGCKLNYAETSTYERGFKAAGLEVVPWSEKADIYLVNTCSVTAVSDRKSRNLVRRVHRMNPGALVVVTGCSAELRRAEIEAIEGVSRVFGADEKALVVPETLKAAGLAAGFDSACGSCRGLLSPAADAAAPVFAAYSTGERTRSFLKVQDGCDNFCAYCTVPYARGRSRNVPIAECVENARKIAAEGVKEIVLTGVNTGDFGRSTGESFLDLLKALNEVPGIERYRISSIEPNLLGEETIDWIASGTKFQPHFHIPLQTGSDELLSRMGRKYDTALFAGKLEYIRSRMETPGSPKVFFGIDLTGVHPRVPLLQAAGYARCRDARAGSGGGEAPPRRGRGGVVRPSARRVHRCQPRRPREGAVRVHRPRRLHGGLHRQLHPRLTALRPRSRRPTRRGGAIVYSRTRPS